MAEIRLKSYEFRRGRQASWTELDRLVARVEKGGLGALGAGDLARLPVLYRAALSSLSVARAISLDRNVLDYLEALSGRAYACVYSARRRLPEAVADFFAEGLPRALRRFRWPLLLAALALVLGTAAGWALTAADPNRFWSFVSEDMAGGRGPSASTEYLRSVLYHQGGAAESLATFASFLFTHNARIGLLAFALGFAAGVPSFLLLFVTGLMLGAFAAVYASRGLGGEFWAWILPHGVPELTAVVLCGGAGLVLAQALVFPGRLERLRSLAIRGREAGTLVVAAVLLFFVAGIIEGVFRQTVHSVPVRYAVAIGGAVLLVLYGALVGRGKR
jgi:uncharacterized membrane protein SpoIIM required for sporulation